ncbi:hypothetical protein PLESTB_000781200 [Pleodorina starrii]|uniref:Uncharacterized protein n=1 Tax=Pleodorina starrii TaxID=330485 RepID=A0A9W6F2T2_9CHLO|nr:hypothetical protein PLESTM_000503700 [Pleodorina starrii]GLC53730.1 hypothetical protein PLESTB_000781200 [Pleodorina starrii]
MLVAAAADDDDDDDQAAAVQVAVQVAAALPPPQQQQHQQPCSDGRGGCRSLPSRAMQFSDMQFSSVTESRGGPRPTSRYATSRRRVVLGRSDLTHHHPQTPTPTGMALGGSSFPSREPRAGYPRGGPPPPGTAHREPWPPAHGSRLATGRLPKVLSWVVRWTAPCLSPAGRSVGCNESAGAGPGEERSSLLAPSPPPPDVAAAVAAAAWA